MKILCTTFQLEVWNEIKKNSKRENCILQIYSQKYRQTKYLQRVANVCSKNPFPIKISCHKVIKENGEIDGHF